MILFEQWAGHRLLIEKHCLVSISSVPVSEGIEIRKRCQFVSSLFRASGKLPGGRFLPCSVGRYMSRLRHLGCDQCSHGLTSMPLERCHRNCFQAVCVVLGYPKGAAAELLDGTLKLRYCTTVLTRRIPLWSLPGRGDGKRDIGTATPVSMDSGSIFKESGFPGTPVPGTWSIPGWIQNFQRQSDGKGWFPQTPQELGERWAGLSTFFLALGLVEIDVGVAWNLLPWATGIGFLAGQSSQRDQ